MMLRRFLADARGAAAVEMALMLPFLLTLMFGGFEIGNYFWSEHKVVEGVRAGVRYASRQPIDTLCPTQNSTTLANIQNVTRTGKLDSTAAPLVPGWTANSQVTVTVRCASYVSTGIYSTLGTQGATVTVSTNGVAHPSLFKALGVVTSGYALNAWSSAPVIGI